MNTRHQGLINLILSTLAFVISSAGSVLLHIVFAATLFRSTGSGLLTALFLSLQWLPVFVVILYKSNWDDGRNPRKSWMRYDLLSAALTLPVLLFIDKPNFLMIFIILFSRGIIDHVTRILKTIASRTIFPQEKSVLYASILQTGYHFGIGLAAILGFTMSSSFSLVSVTVIDIASYIIAAILLLFVKDLYTVEVKTQANSSFLSQMSDFKQAIMSHKKLLFCVVLPPITSALFQGTYSVLQPIFPLKILELDTDAVALSYVFLSVAILLGSTSFTIMSKKYALYEGDFSKIKFLTAFFGCISVLSYLACVSLRHPLLCAILFSVMVLAFEMLFMIGYAGVVAYSPKGQLGSVFAITFSIGCCAASLCAVLTGFILDFFAYDFTATISLFMSFFVILLMANFFIYERPFKSLGVSHGTMDHKTTL